ncbi:hypothetical protein BDQ17DRAFT_1540286 [Cyathus striatus]|nr:hypothetical protein BDQ17DRAFT_1540286 [Cyathus striatus]
MSLTVLARAATRQNAIVGARTLHTSPVTRSAHDNYHHLPFQWPGERKLAFGTKVFVYLAFGFSIPFGAAYYQLRKSASA